MIGCAVFEFDQANSAQRAFMKAPPTGMGRHLTEKGKVHSPSEGASATNPAKAWNSSTPAGGNKAASPL
jgi:hypothetical protein